MPKNFFLAVIMVFTITVFTNCNTKSDLNYVEVKIGNQIWMKNNLNVEKFRNAKKD